MQEIAINMPILLTSGVAINIVSMSVFGLGSWEKSEQSLLTPQLLPTPFQSYCLP